MEAQMTEHVKKITECETNIKHLEERLDKMDSAVEDIKQLTVSIERLAINMEFMLHEQQEQSKRLESLENIPKNNWHELGRFVITTIVGACIGYFTKLIMG